MIQRAWSAAFAYHNNDHMTRSLTSLSNGVVTTFRLREAPLKTLRRCMRLFLCAGAGPGAMRGDGTNGWISVLGDDIDACSSCSNWQNVSYPGLSSRFGLEYYELSHCYTSVPSTTDNSHGELEESATLTVTGPFSRYSEFQLWELGVELRSFIDQANEVYEIEKQTLRRKERESSKLESRGSSVFEEGVQQGECAKVNHATIHLLARDGFALLTEDGRKDLVRSIMIQCFNEANEAQLLQHTKLNLSVTKLCCQIEVDILTLSNDKSDDNDDDGFISDTERLIAATAIICHRVLQLRIKYQSTMLISLVNRPWLRHMCFDAILTYILWDCVPIFERRGHHLMAVSILQTILFGQDDIIKFNEISGELMSDSSIKLDGLEVNSFVECLLPRRNRGKACERLIIDITHAERRAKKAKQSTKKKARKKSNSTNENDDNDKVKPSQSLCKSILENFRTTGSVPFCSLRNLARRSKDQLPQTNERSLLNIRPGEDNGDDWSPTTDCAIANAITSDTSDCAATGKRCSFVGWEIEDQGEAHRSLNVEELAMEQYYLGLLPCDDEGVKGKWLGWHNEGGHVRALFRILCLPHLMEGCPPKEVHHEHYTVILTPYQSSPHDLHVGRSQTVRGFYERRCKAIESFLSDLSELDNSDISNQIYIAIKKRWEGHAPDRSRLKDPRLLKDVSELRTLSMIGSALGPTALVRIFRTLCFDYRHWSGGLPDLFLVRAQNSSGSFVSLADWVGEGFTQKSIDEKNVQNHISMLADRDDEFLGQPKNADGFSSQQYSSRRKKGTARVELSSFPEKLEFTHEDKRVKTECMFVEVKSANDRLSERQEDWLSILESCTNARVCKFTSSSSK